MCGFTRFAVSNEVVSIIRVLLMLQKCNNTASNLTPHTTCFVGMHSSSTDAAVREESRMLASAVITYFVN